MEKKWLYVVLIIIVLKISVWFTPLVRDGFGYAYVGGEIARGKILYKEIWDHKPPGVYFLDALIYKFSSNYINYLIAIRLADIFFAIFSAYLFYSFLRIYYSKKSAYLSTLLFTVFSNVYILTQGSNLVETYMLPILILLYYTFVIGLITDKKNYLLLSGFLLGILFIFKQVGILPAGAIGIYLLWKRRDFLRRVFLLMLGFLIAITPLIIYFWLNKALFSALDAIFLYNFSYTKQGYSLLSLGQSIYYLLQVFLATLPFWYFVLLGLWRFKMQSFNFLFLLFLVFALFGTAMGGRFAFTRNYFVLTLPAAGYFAGRAIEDIYLKFSRNTLFKGIAILSLAMFFLPSLLLQGQAVLSGLNYLNLFNPGEQQTLYTLGLSNYHYIHNEKGFREITEYLDRFTKPGDYILDWGAEPQLYVLTGARAPTRYFYNFPLNGAFITNDPRLLERRAVFMNELLHNNPLYIVANDKRIRYQFSFAELNFPEFKQFIQKNYKLEKQINNYLIFRLHEKSKDRINSATI